MKAKERVKELCSKGTHNSGGWLFNNGGGSGFEFSYRISECDCGGIKKENSFGDINCEKCEKGKKNQSNLSQFLPTLQNLQNYFQANNIHQITQQSNGDLLITFNPTNSSNNSPPPNQTITNQQLTSETSTMEQEQKTMWQKFKDYLKKTGKNKIDKKELEQEIKKLKTNSEQKPEETKTWPWIVGGIGIAALLGIIIALIRKRKKAQED